MDEKVVKRMKATQSVKELTIKEHENDRKKSNQLKDAKAEVASLYRQQEDAIIKKYQADLPAFLDNRMEQIRQDVKALAEEVATKEIKVSLEPVVMKILSKPFRRARNRANLYYKRACNGI